MRSMLTWQRIWSNQRISWWLSKIKKKNVTVVKQVYNALQRYKIFIRPERLEMEHLLKYMDDHNYVIKFRTVDEPTIVQDIFLARLEFVNLLKTSHTVLFIDSLYKTD